LIPQRAIGVKGYLKKTEFGEKNYMKGFLPGGKEYLVKEEVWRKRYGTGFLYRRKISTAPGPS